LYLNNTSDVLNIKMNFNPYNNLNTFTHKSLPQLLNVKLSNFFLTRKTNTNYSPIYNSNTDIFYNNSTNTLFDSNLVYLNYAITNSKTSNNSNYSYYSLNNNLKMIKNVEIQQTSDIITNLTNLKSELQKQPIANVATVDLLNKEYTKDLFRLLVLTNTNFKL